MHRARRLNLVLAAALLALAVVAAPALGARRNTHIDVHQTLVGSCAVGDFVAHGVIEDSGSARACLESFNPPAIERGRMRLVGDANHLLDWRMQCKADPPDRARHFDCKGQWTLVGGPFRGGGNVRAIFDFVAGTVDWSMDGNVG